MQVAGAIFTIGHGRREASELVACLREADVATLVDVRRYPGSRRNPQFNQKELAAALAEAGIAYRHVVELGGLRSNEPGEERFACVGSFAGYAARMGTPEWQDALALVLDEKRPSRAVTRSCLCSARANESRTGRIRPPRCETDGSISAEVSSARAACSGKVQAVRFVE